jgi:hypothetical protein
MVAQPPLFSGPSPWLASPYRPDVLWRPAPSLSKGLLHCPLTAIMAATIRRGSPYYPRQWSHVRLYWR